MQTTGYDTVLEKQIRSINIKTKYSEIFLGFDPKPHGAETQNGARIILTAARTSNLKYHQCSSQ
jgi:hypothetical protein